MLIILTILSNLDLGLQVADPLLGIGAFLSMASLLGGLFSNSQQQATNEKNIAFQQQENALNRMFAREQMATQQQYNQVNAAQAYRRQREFYDYMYSKNTMKSMVEQAEEAGVNPFALFDSQGFQGTSVPSVQQASAATPVNAMGVAPHEEMIPSSFDKSVGAFSSIASALASLSQSGKNNAETQSILAKLQPEIDKLLNESALLHDQDVKLQLHNALDAWFSFSERQKGMDKLDKEISSLTKSLLLQDESLTKERFENSLNWMRKEILDNQRKLSKTEFLSAQYHYNKLEEVYRHTFALQESQTRAANASAEESSAKAQTENQNREYVLRINHAIAQLDERENAFRDQTFISDLNVAMDEMQRSGINTEILQKSLEKAKKENSIFYWKEFLNMAKDVAIGVGAVGLGTKGARSSGTFRSERPLYEPFKPLY